MSVFDEHRERLEDYETMLGRERGRLALTLDLVTDALTRVGRHSVSCRSGRDPAAPPLDLERILDDLAKAKELVQRVMEDLGAARGRG
jgi:hypothetical protein